jgi:ribonuclease HII
MPSRRSWLADQRRHSALAAPRLVDAGDEPGRGPLAGPVVAAAVILDDLAPIKGLKDSKALGARTRERLFDEIRAKALCCSIAQASAQEIDASDILQATLLAMRRAVDGLRLRPHEVLVDGNRLPALLMPAQAIVKGDARVQAIAAASILAKVQRDRLCVELHARYPRYGFDGHKGYPTPAHLSALRAHGPCAEHRRSFGPVRDALAGAAQGTR